MFYSHRRLWGGAHFVSSPHVVLPELEGTITNVWLSATITTTRRYSDISHLLTDTCWVPSDASPRRKNEIIIILLNNFDIIVFIT